MSLDQKCSKIAPCDRVYVVTPLSKHTTARNALKFTTPPNYQVAIASASVLRASNSYKPTESCSHCYYKGLHWAHWRV